MTAGRFAFDPAAPDEAVLRKLQQTIRKVGDDIPRLSYNTAVAAMMEYINVVRAHERRPHRAEVEPLAWYGASRVQKEFAAGRHGLGFIGTGETNRVDSNAKWSGLSKASGSVKVTSAPVSSSEEVPSPTTSCRR